MRLAVLLLMLVTSPTRADVRHFGVMVDAGVPEGAGAALVVRPVRALRLHGGATYNGVSTGLAGGVTFVPFASWLSPTLTVDGGELPEGDANQLVQRFDPGASSPVLRRIGYRYENARLGLELGAKRATFYIDAGVSHITGRLHDAAAELGGGDPSIMVTSTDPRVEAWSVSARLGFIIYLGP